MDSDDRCDARMIEVLLGSVCEIGADMATCEIRRMAAGCQSEDVMMDVCLNELWVIGRREALLSLLSFGEGRPFMGGRTHGSSLPKCWGGGRLQ